VTVSGLNNVKSVTSSFHYNCALINDGTVKCWGANSSGQLGDGTTTSSNLPVSVLISNVTSVSSGNFHSCALINDGTVKCWGINNSGQLGDGTTVNRIAPVAVTGLTNVGKIIVEAGTHTCALINDGSIKCWGRNDYGQLGDGSTTNKSAPASVTGISNAVDVAAGEDHTCAVINDGTVKCWGRNYHAQLGTGSSGRNTPQSTPVSTTGISTATGISSYNNFSCAVLSNQSIQCWGLNNDAQIGDGTAVFDSSTYERKTPTNVIEINTATAISSGVDHSCALLADKTLKCWGSNDYGQLGIGEISNRSSTPLTVLQD
jgi:alpha-tubulin suppressor-like RCC1 family protein